MFPSSKVGNLAFLQFGEARCLDASMVLFRCISDGRIGWDVSLLSCYFFEMFSYIVERLFFLSKCQEETGSCANAGIDSSIACYM